MHLRLRTVAAWTVVLGGALSCLACSSLTRPDDITIAPEPLPSRDAPTPMQAPPPPDLAAAGAPGQPAGTG